MFEGTALADSVVWICTELVEASVDCSVVEDTTPDVLFAAFVPFVDESHAKKEFSTSALAFGNCSLVYDGWSSIMVMVVKAQMADPSEMVVEEQQTVELAIVVDATHEAVEEKDPVTEQPTVVLVSVVQDDDVPIELQDMMVKVAMLLEHELEDVEAVFEVELCELDSTLFVGLSS